MDGLSPVPRRTAGNTALHNTLAFQKKKEKTCLNRFARLGFYITSAYLKHKNLYNPVRPRKLKSRSKQRSWAFSPLRIAIMQLNPQFWLIKSLRAYKRPQIGRGAIEYPNVTLKPVKDSSKDALLWPKESGTGVKLAQLVQPLCKGWH